MQRTIYFYFLVHLSDEGVDLVLAVTQVTSLDEVAEFASAEATGRVGELEWPQEVGGLLEEIGRAHV